MPWPATTRAIPPARRPSSPVRFPITWPTLDTPIDGLRLGIAKQYMGEGNDPTMAAALNRAIAQFKDMGATIVEVDLPHTEYGIPGYYIVATAEASEQPCPVRRGPLRPPRGRGGKT